MYWLVILVFLVYLYTKHYGNIKFKRWCNSNHIKVNKVDICSFNGMRGLCATDDIHRGDILVHMPLESCIYAEVPKGLSMLHQDLILATCIHEDDFKDSKYKGYIDFMPKGVHLISEWSDDEINSINYPKANELRETQRRENDACPPHLKRYLDLVRSRRIKFEFEDTVLLVMMPVIDLINHDTKTQKINFEADIVIEHEHVILRSPRDYKKGEEVVMCYGDSNSEIDSVDHHLMRHGIPPRPA